MLPVKRKAPEREIAPVKINGALWFPGIGGKERMQREAANMGDACQLQITEPNTGVRGFIAFPDWPTAIDKLAHMQAHRRHIFEIVRYGLPCKPHLDIDVKVPDNQTAEETLAAMGLVCAEDIVSTITAATKQIFEQDYELVLHDDDFVWIVSPGNPRKVSYHLVIDTAHRLGSSVVYRVNNELQGAKHLAERLVEVLPPALAKTVDRAIYTKDREFRMLGSKKHPLNKKEGVWKTTYTAEALRPDLHGEKEACVTWLTEPLTFINVPCMEPRPLARKRVLASNIKEPADLVPAVTSGDDLDNDDTTWLYGRLLELVQTVHPSAYRDASHGIEQIHNPARGVKFNYTDRSEPCWTGCIHEHTQNFRAWVQGDEAWAACFSADCEGKPKLLGALHVDPEYHLAEAVHVDQQFIDLEADPHSSRKLREWLDGKHQVLNVKSNMGTGKTTMLQGLLDKHFKGATVLVVTYRRTLAANINGKLRGFRSYEDPILKPRYDSATRQWINPLSDRQYAPRVICQLESLHRMADNKRVPRFDFIVLDEVESLLNHFSSTTLANPAETADLLQTTLRGAKHVLAMDALWGLETWTWFDKLRMPQATVVNDFKTNKPRAFVFENHEHSWQLGIKDDLAAGKNVRPPPPPRSRRCVTEGT